MDMVFGHFLGLPLMLKESSNSLLSFLPLGCGVLCLGLALPVLALEHLPPHVRLSSYLFPSDSSSRSVTSMCCMTCSVTVVTEFILVNVFVTCSRFLFISFSISSIS